MADTTPKTLEQGAALISNTTDSAAEYAPPSAKTTASRMLSRSASSTRKTRSSIATPSADATPRTLIGGLLHAASISKSGVHAPQTRKSKLKPSPLTAPATKRRKSLRQSIGDNATPRTIIKNFLMEASPESPLAPPEPQEEMLQNKENDGSHQTIPNEIENTNVPAVPSLDQTLDKEMTTSDHENNNSFELDDSPIDNHLGEPKVNSNSDSEKDEEGTQTIELDVFETSNTQVSESLTRTENEQSSLELNDVEQAGSSREIVTENRWKDLVTPRLPIPKRVLSETHQIQEENIERGKEAVKVKKPSRKTTKAKRTSVTTDLPSSLVKSIFQHFTRKRISNSTLNAIEKGSSVFYKNISSDLAAYCKHAGRKTIEIEDVELLMKRQGFVTDKQSLYSLIEKYLPLEYRQELIPIVQSGNKILLKK